MKSFIGVKKVQAEPESKDGREGFKVVYEEGYESWCPKDVFLKHNRAVDGLPFSFALEAVKQGKKIARTGWNGKGMYVTYKPGYPDGVAANAATAQAHGIPEGTNIIYCPYLEMKTADDKLVPWLVSQTDALADDWQILD